MRTLGEDNIAGQLSASSKQYLNEFPKPRIKKDIYILFRVVHLLTIMQK